MECYLHFTLAMGRSLGFASAATDCRALFRLALASAPYLKYLTSPVTCNSYAHYAKGTPSLLRAPTACRRTVSGSLSLPCSGCFPPFPHGTGPLSVFRKYLALRDGPRSFRQDSTCPALLRFRARITPVACTGVSPSVPRLSRRFQFLCDALCTALQPRRRRNAFGLGSSPFDRHYSGNRLSFFSWRY